MNALILGSGGMLARDLQRELDARGHTTVTAAHAQVDITNPTAVRHAVSAATADMIFNCAAYTKVDQAEAEPQQAFAVNAAGARNVAAAAASAGIPVVYVSTDYVFDGDRQGGYLEADPPNPLSVYGKSKALGEYQVRSVNPRHIIVRTQWLYGVGGPNFVRTMLNLGAQRDRLQVVNDQIGSPTYTPDLAAAMVALAEDQAFGTYHVTNSGHCSWKTFAELIFRRSGMAVQVDPITTAQLARPARRPLNSVLLNSMWESDGRLPLRSYEQAVTEFLQLQRGESE